MNVPSILMSILMGLLSAYFFVAEKFQINAFLQKCVPQPVKKQWQIVKNTMTKAFGGYFLAQLKIEIWMYLLLVVGLVITGTKYAVLVALGIAVLDFLPVFGTGTVLVPWAIIKILNGNYTTAIILLVLWGGGQLLRQMIQPRIGRFSGSIHFADIDPFIYRLAPFRCWRYDSGSSGRTCAV